MNPARAASAALIVMFLPAFAAADTLHLSDNRGIKGLVVEEHDDRVVLSTADGEQIYLRKDISSIEYDEPEYNLLNLGRETEKSGREREALSFYERALMINPELIEAKQAALGVKSRIWAEILDEGPIGEVSRAQDFYDSYRANVDVDSISRKKEEDREKLLWERLGVRLAVRDNWVVAGDLRIGGYLYKRGLRTGDGFVSADGRSLRFLNTDAVTQYLLEPRYSNATLVIRRTVSISKSRPHASLKEIGIRLSQEYNGLTVSQVRSGKEKELRLRRGDIINDIGGVKTRYMPQRDAVKMLEDSKSTDVRLTIHRPVTIARK